MVQHADIDHTGVTGAGASAHIADTSDAHDASAISFSPTGTIASTDVQAAIAEVASEAAAGSGIASGTGFPGGPANNDVFYRTDRDILYFYDGTRWLSLNLYRENMSALTGSTTTSGTIVGRLPVWHSTYDLWLESLWTALYVGTTNTGSAYWTAALKKYQSDFATSSTLASVDTSANSPNVMVAATAAIGALLTPATYKILQLEVAKTGSPGLIHPAGAVSYRLVG